jgi:hypothetical protein
MVREAMLGKTKRRAHFLSSDLDGLAVNVIPFLGGREVADAHHCRCALLQQWQALCFDLRSGVKREPCDVASRPGEA